MTLCILGVILAQGFWLYRDYRYYKSQPFFSSDYDIFLPTTPTILSTSATQEIFIKGSQIGSHTIIAYPMGVVTGRAVKAIPALPVVAGFARTAAPSVDISMFDHQVRSVGAMPVEFAKTTAYKAPASYIFNKMKWQFGVSVLLIMLTTCSLAYMLITIFRQQRMSVVKNDFINSMAHELKTPLATISVAVEAIKRYGTLLDKNKTERYLEISTNEINHLSKLIELILQESIFDNDKMVLHKESTDVNELIRQIIENYSIKNAKAVDIKLERSNEIPALLIDPLHLSNALRNIIDNAIKYANDDVIIRITSIFDNGVWRLSIRDTGIGIPEKYHDDIFERFFRVSTSDDTTGSFGLGLSYVKKVVELHEGSIGLESTLTIGSTFLISIPFKS